MTLSPKETLLKARELISDPKRWTQESFARDGRGRSASIANGVCFCSIGAIASVAGTNLVRPVPDSILKLAGFKSHAEWARFNDSHTHAEALAVFDRAIERASSPEPQP
jgi:hypothetical protein